jgi:hypothetical protein
VTEATGTAAAAVASFSAASGVSGVVRHAALVLFATKGLTALRLTFTARSDQENEPDVRAIFSYRQAWRFLKGSGLNAQRPCA